MFCEKQLKKKHERVISLMLSGPAREWSRRRADLVSCNGRSL